MDSGHDIHHSFLYPLLGDLQSPFHPHRCSGLVDRPLRWPSLGDTGGEEQIKHETPLVRAGLPSAAPAAFPSSPPSPSSVHSDPLSWQGSLVSRMESGFHRDGSPTSHNGSTPPPASPKATSLSSAPSPVPSPWSLFSHHSYVTISTARQEPALQPSGDTGGVLPCVF